LDTLETIYAKDRHEWRSWLDKNHNAKKEVWLVIYKKQTGKPAVAYEDAVGEAICFGWIDGRSKTIDDEKYMQRYTPRTSRSHWSQSNIQRAEKMIEQGRMTEAGLKAFRQGAPAKAENKFVAFLRGINVGGHSVIKMEDLRKTFDSMGFGNVKTVLASGNVLFEAPGKKTATLVRDIQTGLAKSIGREVLAIVRPLEDLRKLADGRPFKGVDAEPGTRLFVTLVSEGAKQPRSPAISGKGFEVLSYSGGIICSVLHEESGVGAVQLMGAIEKEFGSNVTTRSWETIQKILKAGG